MPLGQYAAMITQAIPLSLKTATLKHPCISAPRDQWKHYTTKQSLSTAWRHASTKHNQVCQIGSSLGGKYPPSGHVDDWNKAKGTTTPGGLQGRVRVKPFFSGLDTLPQEGGACLPFWKFWVPSAESPPPPPPVGVGQEWVGIFWEKYLEAKYSFCP